MATINNQIVITALDKASAVLNQLSGNAKKAAGDVGGIGVGLSRTMGGAAAALGSIAAIGFPVKMAIDFETAMLGVAKQVDGARGEGGQLTSVYFQMRKEIQALSTEIPIAAGEIAGMVTAGARMGVARNELIGFVKTSAMMAEAFELPSAELADKMGKIAGLYKIPIPEINRLADTINYLDDNAISKGGDIIDYLTRVGGVAGAVKISNTEVAALGSTLLTLGERTETAGTATNAFFQKLAAADSGSKKMKSALKSLGLSARGVQKGMQVDAMGTMLDMLDRVGKMPAEQRLGILVDMVGLEHSDTVAKLATNTGELRKQIGLANSEMAKGSMQREFSARMDTSAAQLKILKNQLENVAINLGTLALPAVNKFASVLGGVISGVTGWVEENPRLAASLGYVAAGLIATKFAGMALGAAFLAAKVPMLSFIVASKMMGVIPAMMTLVSGGVVAALTAIKVAVMSNPVGLFVGALVTAGALIYANWDVIGPMFSRVADVAVGSLKMIGGSALWLLENALRPVLWAIDKITGSKLQDGIASMRKDLMGVGQVQIANGIAGYDTKNIDDETRREARGKLPESFARPVQVPKVLIGGEPQNLSDETRREARGSLSESFSRRAQVTAMPKQEVGGSIDVRVRSDGQAVVDRVEGRGGLEVRASTGLMMGAM